MCRRSHLHVTQITPLSGTLIAHPSQSPAGKTSTASVLALIVPTTDPFVVSITVTWGRAVAQIVEPLTRCVEENAVRIALHIDGLNRCESFAVEHNDGAAGEEPVIGLRVNDNPVSHGIRNFAHRCKRVEIKNRDATGRAIPWNV